MDGTCEDLTGRCYCRPNFTGEHCAACAEGFTGFPRCYREGVGWGAGGAGPQSPEPCGGPGAEPLVLSAPPAAPS